MNVISSRGGYPIPSNEASLANGQHRLSSNNTERKTLSENSVSNVLRSTETVDLTASKTKQLSTDAPTTYEHLSKSLTAQNLSLDDLKKSLSSLSALMGTTQSYEGKARTYEESVRSREVEGGLPSVTTNAGNLFSLTVTTKDGDEVHISIDLTKGTDDLGDYSELSISFNTSGELDEGEQQALSQLTNSLGGLAQDYREKGWTEMKGIAAFDASELSGFNVSIDGADDNSFDITYTINEIAGQRALAVNQNGYEYDIKVDMQGFMLDNNVTENAHYLQYQKLILDTAHSYKSGEQANIETARFFLDGMNAIFQASNKNSDDNATASADTEESNNGSNKQRLEESLHPNLIYNFGEKEGGLLDTFSSGLADFTASFITPKLRMNESNPSEVSMMSLSFSQTTSKTETLSVGKYTTSISQQSEFKSKVSQHLGLGGDDIKYANLGPAEEGGQSYLFRTETQQSAIIRTLNFDDNKNLASFDEKRYSEHLRNDKEVVRGKVTKHDTTDLTNENANSDKHFPLPELTKKEFGDLQVLKNIEQIIDASKVTLFL